MILAHRITLDPTVEQAIALARACGVARFTWNWALAKWDELYKAGEKPNAGKLKAMWNGIKGEAFPWVYESPKDANQQPFANLDKAFKRFFKKKSGRPKFKKKGVHDSFYVSNDKFDIVGKMIRLPVIGHVRLREALRFAGKITAATVSRQADRWFVSIQVDTPDQPLPPVDEVIGVDLGIKTAAVCSDGRTFDAPKPLKRNLDRLRCLARRVSRKVKGSKNRFKARLKLARLRARIGNIRMDFLHKVTSTLIRENQAVCVEDLNVKGLAANRCLSRAISDIGFAEFRRMLEYKAKFRGRRVVVISRWEPTSKACSGCGCLKDDLSLSDRVYRCGHCGVEIDRDLNAAINIHTAGLAEIHACGQDGAGRGESRDETGLDEAGTKPRANSRSLTN